MALLILEYRPVLVKYIGKSLGLGLILYIAFAAVEWGLQLNDPSLMVAVKQKLPSYSRVSLVFGAYCLFLLALGVNHSANTVIKFMSYYSLSVYCLHMFFLPQVQILISNFSQNAYLLDITSSVLAIILCYVAAWSLKFYLNRNMLF